ncbi:hypothetical protein BKA61DRAFT_707232 [Leptodontidium sp. MPI-SDFR-AT-0119]|nr:hypothetical protein BKA61DRAFT_707232 [Leptodontidium sp. MPI-SDFR-AT-0119]
MPSLPKQMRGVVFHSTGDSSVLQIDNNLPLPVLQPSEILVKVEYAGVNFVDTYLRSGLYPVKLPAITGREGAGTVVQVGDQVDPSLELAIGDRVAVFTQGTMAEYVCAPAAGVMKLSSEVSSRAGAAIMLQGLTAWTMVRDSHDVKEGEVILVQAAAGGTGGLIVQMCKHLGATVIGTVSTAVKAKVAREHGCDHVIIYTESNIEAEVNRLTDEQGCHAVFSGIGASTFDADLRLTRRKGVLVSYGNSSGPVTNFKILDLSKRNVKLVRPTLANYITTREEMTTRSGELLELIGNGAVKVKFGQEYSLEHVGAAQDDLVSQKTMGKLIVKI